MRDRRPAGGPELLLVGMMGAGKSTVARLLADRLGWPVVDTDEIIEGWAGASVAEIFDHDGEAVFRAAEAKAIAELEQAEEPLVVSVGGGAVVSDANRRALRAAGTVVWLRARPSTLAARVGSGGSRPLLSRGGTDAGRACAPGLRPRDLLPGAADLVVDVDDIPAAKRPIA